MTIITEPGSTTNYRTIKIHRHDDGNEVSVDIEINMTKPYYQARARKLVELAIHDLEAELFGDNDD